MKTTKYLESILVLFLCLLMNSPWIQLETVMMIVVVLDNHFEIDVILSMWYGLPR